MYRGQKSHQRMSGQPVAMSSPRTTRLITNSYRLQTLSTIEVLMYDIQIEPFIETDNMSLKRKLVKNLRRELESQLGRHVHAGGSIFVLRNSQPEGEVNSVQLTNTVADVTYTLNFTFTKVLNVKQRENMSTDELTFLNILLRDLLKRCKLKQIGNNRNHFNMNQGIVLQTITASVIPGFFTSIQETMGGLSLTIDCCFKLVRDETVFQIIEQIQKRDGPHARRTITEELKDKIVIASYGNNNCFRIVDVAFDMTPRSTFLMDGGRETTFEQYYRDRYQISITVPNQPLLLATVSIRRPPVYIIPELCRMTGTSSLDDEMELKKEVSNHTRLRAFDRQKRITSMVDLIKSQENNEWGLDIEAQPIEVEAKNLPPPQVLFGNSQLTVDYKGVFNFQNQEVFSSAKLERWQLFFTDRDRENAQKFVAGLQRVGQTSGIQVNKPLFECVNDGARGGRLEQHFISKLQSSVRDGCQMSVVLLPRNLSRFYKEIKQILTQERPVGSQVVLTSTVMKNNLSVFSKILLQMMTKIGGTPWVVQMPRSLPQYTMTVGIDVCHNTFSRGQSVLGFSASLSSDFSSYYSRIAFHEEGQEISDVLAPLFKESFKEFFKANNRNKPQCIIVYRDGVGTSQYKAVSEVETPQIVEAIHNFDSSWKPQIIVLIVNKRVNQRLFKANGNKIDNPGHGLVVDSDIVWPIYNFFMVSHLVNSGSLTPTHYNVIVNQSDVDPSTLYQLTYNLCYMYFNWFGGVRVPAPCMHAHKIAYLVGKHTGVDFGNDLRNFLFYL